MSRSPTEKSASPRLEHKEDESQPGVFSHFSFTRYRLDVGSETLLPFSGLLMSIGIACRQRTYNIDMQGPNWLGFCGLILGSYLRHFVFLFYFFLGVSAA